MDLPAWQERLAEAPADVPLIAKVPFLEAKKFFAVDGSGSTAGSIMRAQAQTVRALHGNSKDTVAKWESACDNPSALDNVAANFFDSNGGTYPHTIMRNPQVVDQIRESDLWVLLTDGQINERDVMELTRLAGTMDVIQVPVVLIITGGKRSTPAQTHISVGIPFFASAQEALILFKDVTTGQLSVIDAKGSFASLKTDDTGDLSSWNSLSAYADEMAFNKHCADLSVDLIQSTGRQSRSAVSLGPDWDAATNNILVDVSALLAEKQLRLEDLRNLLGMEAITQLALICKLRGQLPVLRDLILEHKQQEVVIRLEDRHGAGKVLEKLQSDTFKPGEKEQLLKQLRHAHSANRETYIELQNSPSEEARRATEVNRLIDRGLRIISSFEKSSYTADILNRKSNRAMRAEKISAAESEVHQSALDLSDNIKAFRGTCPICCGDEQIMSIVLKRLDTVEENTTDFALNFPLAAGHAKQNADMISSQCICFQCALLCPRSIYQEDIVATVPTIDYQGPNKKYINHQLTLAITAGLATGVPGIIQIFMTILDKTLATKAWCSQDLASDPEVLFRRQLLIWTLGSLLRGLKCRENFTDNGNMVDYPRALLWAVKDYEEAHLDSWIIQYPIAGFNQLLRWYEMIIFPVDPKSIDSIQRAKLIHLTITTMMNGLLQQQKNDDKSWTHPFLEVIYRDFNAPGVPQDLGEDSIISAGQFRARLQNALDPKEDVKLFVSSFHGDVLRQMTNRIQLVVFWALYLQKGHTMPKHFFATIMSREPLAPAVLDPTATIPAGAVKDVLMSIFCPVRQLKGPHDAHLCKDVPPFINPFGPSVLRCGQLNCPVRFYSEADLEAGMDPAIQIRERRAKHFSDIYGIDTTFMSQTGLPDPTQAPKAPTSYHNTLHISTARSWSRLDPKRKQAIAQSISDDKNGDSAVVEFIKDVRFEIVAKSHRGNIYSADIDGDVRSVLPSLLLALRVASEKAGLEDKSGLAYVHDWTMNTIRAKMEFELSLA